MAAVLGVSTAVFYDDAQGYPALCKDTTNHVLATEADDQWAWAGRVAARLATHTMDYDDHNIAFIGGGFCILPRILDLAYWNHMHIYEIEQYVIDWTREHRLDPRQRKRFKFIHGDYVDTLPSSEYAYDVIVYHLATPPNVPVLRAALAPRGWLIGVTDGESAV